METNPLDEVFNGTPVLTEETKEEDRNDEGLNPWPW